MNYRMVLTLAALGATAMSFSQAQLTGPDQFPQFRVMSGLPGGGFAVNSKGIPDPKGAFALSTPLGYALGGNSLVAGLANTSPDLSFKLPSTSTTNITGWYGGNGTGQVMYGFDLKKYGNLTASYMVLSSIGDSAYNFQYQPPVQFDKTAFSIGVQDVRGRGGSAGQDAPGDGISSQSFFLAATHDFGKGTYLSAGGGTRRFLKGFVNASTNLGPDIKAMMEHDGFNFSGGVLYTLPTQDDRTDQNVSFFLGLTRMQYLSWSVNVAF